MNTFTKTLLLSMTISLFFALFQILLKQESIIQKQSKIKINEGKIKSNTSYTKIIREEKENIPDFIVRFKDFSFSIWEISYPFHQTIKDKIKQKEQNETRPNSKI